MSARRATGDSSLRPPLRLDETRTLQDVAGPPVLADDLLLVTRGYGALEAYDERTGGRIWRVPLPAPDPAHGGAPLVAGGLIHVRAGSELLSIDRAGGAVVARLPSPRLDLADGALVAGSVVSWVGESHLQAFDLATGTLRWSVEHPFSPVPIAGERDLVVAGGAGSVAAFDVRDGAERWSSPVEGDIGAIVIAPGGEVLVAAGTSVASLDPETGAVRWRAPAGVARPGTLAVTDDGEIHLLDLDRYRRLSAASGAVLLARDLDRATLPRARGSLGRLSASRSHVFSHDQRGPLVAVSRSTGGVDWISEEDDPRPRAASDAPVLSGRRLYARTFDGWLQSFVEVP
jgi:outer membrane protein assembly factor BamB